MGNSNFEDLDLPDLIVHRKGEFGISWRELAARSGGLVSHATLNNIARRKHVGTLTERVLQGLASALDVPLDRVMTAAGQTRPGRGSGRRPGSLSPAQRVLRARIAAHTLHARIGDPAAHTAPARAQFAQRFYDEVDPNRVLSDAERERRAGHARAAFFLRLSAKGVAARRKQG